MIPEITVIVPTHNPAIERFRATLEGLRRQTFATDRWAVLVVDNASDSFPAPAGYHDVRPPNFLIVREPQLGLTSARRCGMRNSQSALVVFADDDNVLAPDYLANVAAVFASHGRLGLAGGKSVPRFEAEPPEWAREFFPLLALRDLGGEEIVASGFRTPAAPENRYPECAPIGAGMAARREALQSWLERPNSPSDRRGAELSSAGDNDLVLDALSAGWDVGYFPQLCLTHLIPATRLDPTYLGRLNRGIQKSWMQVLRLHKVSQWPTIPAWTVPLRSVKMWLVHRAWLGPAQRIRWQGACGHFEGRVR